MSLTHFWTAFFLVGFAAALGQFVFAGDVEVFKRVVDGMFDSARVAVMEIALPLAGVMTFWLGILAIAEKAGAIGAIARFISPFFSRIFPGVPKDHPATGHMVMNFSANLLGLDNAATPFGLKATESLQSINPRKDEASDAQIMFLVLHTSGLTLIPLSIMAQRAVLGAANPADIFIPCLIATYAATLVSLTVVALRQKIDLLHPVVLAWLGSITAFVAALIWLITTGLTKPQVEVFSKVFSNLVLFGIVIGALLLGLKKKINVYDAFIEGAKGGITTALMIIPYLVGMLVAIGVLRNSGVLGYVVSAFAWFFGLLGVDTEFVASLPTALMKPISGSGSRAMMIDAMKTYGVDSFVGRLACIFQGSADTTFYIVALYFGSVGITKTRYAIPFGLVADFAGVVAAILIAYAMFR
jgi:spore maturation protein SpmA/spore maturation protein SpmB